MPILTTYLLIALSAVLWGANFNLVKPVVAEMPPLIGGADRFLIAAAIMVAITYATGDRLAWRHRRVYLLLGILGVFGFNVFFFVGMGSTSPVNGALIMALNPLLTSVVAYFVLGDEPTSRQWLALPAGLIGVGIVVLGAGAHVHVASGDALLICGGVCWAFYNVYVRKLMPKETSAIANTAGIMIVGALALTVAALASGQRFVVPSLHAGSALLMMAVGGSVLAYLLWNAGIAKIGPARSAIFLNLVPVVSMLIATLGGTPPSHAQLVGGAIVIGAVTFSSLPARQASVPAPGRAG